MFSPLFGSKYKRKTKTSFRIQPKDAYISGKLGGRFSAKLMIFHWFRGGNLRNFVFVRVNRKTKKKEKERKGTTKRGKESKKERKKKEKERKMKRKRK